jgi:hypothetical protein
MGTGAGVVIAYTDNISDEASEQWLYHPCEGSVQSIGEVIVRAVRDYGCFVDDEFQRKLLLRNFPREFKRTTGMRHNIAFLYRITYRANGMSVTVRHFGYVEDETVAFYSRQEDRPHHSVELFSVRLARNRVVSSRFDVREPESYIRTLASDVQPGVRAWRGRPR